MLTIQAMILVISVASLASALTFNCQFEMINWLYVGDLYSCRAVVWSTGSGTILEVVQGTHLQDQTNAHVRSLVISDQFVPRIPEGMNQTLPTLLLPNLIAIQWWYSNLQTISAHDLSQYPLLKVLSIVSNKVTTLDSDLFRYTRALVSIGFQYNELQHVGANVFANLIDLQIVNLVGNPCVDVRADNPQAISNLNANLPAMCPMPSPDPEPPITTPEMTTVDTTVETTIETTTVGIPPEGECTGECLERIKALNATNFQQLARISELESLLEFCVVPENN